MTSVNLPISIAVTDDHALFRKGLISLIHTLGSSYHVVMEASNGNDFIAQMQQLQQPPQLVIMDIHMPGKDGFETVTWLNANHPKIKVLVISMVDNEATIVRMLKMGVKGYLSKDVEPEDLKEAIDSINEKGFYYTDFITGRLLHGLQKESITKSINDQLNDREKEVLKMLCTELSYKEIAAQLNVNVKTIDSYRDNLCKKVNAISRIGLVMYAMKHKLVEMV